jgi:hypothetical protein
MLFVKCCNVTDVSLKKSGLNLYLTEIVLKHLRNSCAHSSSRNQKKMPFRDVPAEKCELETIFVVVLYYVY